MNDQYQLRGVRIGAVIVVAAVAAFLVWFFAIRDGGDDNGTGGQAQNLVGPEAATEADISDLAEKDDHPVFWAGEQPGTSELELTQTTNGNVYVRYLRGDAPIGTPKPDYLTVGTYPFPGAFNALQEVAQRPGAVQRDVEDGGLAVTNENDPTSTYLAYPDEDLQIEVYDPKPNGAFDLVKAGDIQPVP